MSEHHDPRVRLIHVGLPARLYRKVEHRGLTLDGKHVDDLYMTLGQARADIREADRLLDSTAADLLDDWIADIEARIEALT